MTAKEALSTKRPAIRLLFDELASPRVAKALAALDFKAFHVNQEGQPPKGTEDEDLLLHARKTNQVIVTGNHDMVVLCAEEQESVVWLDPRDKDMTLAAQTLMCLNHVQEWDRLVAPPMMAVPFVMILVTLFYLLLGTPTLFPCFGGFLIGYRFPLKPRKPALPPGVPDVLGELLDRNLRRACRGRRACVGYKVDERSVGLVADCGDKRDLTLECGANHVLFVEWPEVFKGASASS